MTNREALEFGNRFWDWFIANSKNLADLHDKEDVQSIANIVTQQLKTTKLDIGWEMGVDVSDTRYFALSPKMSSDQLLVTKTLVDYAPKLDGWKFYSAIPRRDFSSTIEFTNTKGQKIDLDISDWQYYLRVYREDKQFDVTLVASVLPSADEQALRQISMTIVQGVLGELICIESLDTVDLVDAVDEDLKDSLSHISCMYNHVLSLGITNSSK